MIKIFLIFSLPMSLWAGSIYIENRQEYDILLRFFKMGVKDEGYGYVLEGVKPVCNRNYYSLDDFPVAKDRMYSANEFTNSALARKAVPIWNKLCSNQENFVLKAVYSKEDPNAVAPLLEISFINMKSLRKTVHENITLFRYVLGPNLTEEQLVHQIAYRKEDLFKILKNDLVLVGIVLGFGPYNSLMQGRIETLDAFTKSMRDLPPFISKGLVIQNEKNVVLREWTAYCYGSYYLSFAGGDPDFCQENFQPVNPSFGFSTLEEELHTLVAADDPLPPELSQDPQFVFGAFTGGPSNQELFQKLVHAQKYAQSLLKRSDFLEAVLEKIGGQKSQVTCHLSSDNLIPFFCSLSKKKILKVPNAYPRPQDWTQILERVFHHFQSPKLQRAFFQGFSAASSASVETPSMVGACQETLEGLKIALTNLASARTYFETLSKDTSLQEIVPQSVYFKITESGVGTEVKGVDRVRLGYIVEDGQGKVLFANYDQWLKLSETIPSFAHGVQGMRIGEKRTLFIHPAFGYGVMTTLPPCSELVIKVHLMAADECVALKLPPLEPLDLSWIQNPEFYVVIEESIERYPRFVGRFYREMLDKLCPEVDKMSIYQRLSLENDKP